MQCSEYSGHLCISRYLRSKRLYECNEIYIRGWSEFSASFGAEAESEIRLISTIRHSICLDCYCKFELL